jgi:hypothetical protein
MTASTCAYQGGYKGYNCLEEVYGTSPYCILHIDFPDESDPEYAEIIESGLYEAIKSGKVEKVKEKVRKGDTDFTGATVFGVDFSGRDDIKDLFFNDATIQGHVWFNGAKIQGNARFERAKIRAKFECLTTEINGAFSFKNATFESMRTQEVACRKAKQTLEKVGDRNNTDYHFYREMEVKRKQKKWYIRYPEGLLQYGLWFGVYPFRLLLNFALVFAFFACLFWVTNGVYTYSGLTDSMGFSFLNILIPGYGIFTTTTPYHGVLVIAETA